MNIKILMIFSTLLTITMASAQESRGPRGGGMFNMTGESGLNGSMGPGISYSGRDLFNSKNSSFSENKLTINAPVYRSEKDAVMVGVSSSLLHLNDPITLDSGKRVPTDLYKLETSGNFNEQLEDKKMWGVRASVGYAGDRPSTLSQDLSYTLMTNYSFPTATNNRWILSLYFSNNGILGNYIPIPGVAYLYKTETFTGMFGFPMLFMRFTPKNRWTYMVSILGPTIQTEITYGDIKEIQYFTGFYWTRQSYIQHQRDNDKDRLTLTEKKSALGARTTLWKRFTCEAQIGEAFGRSFYIGNGFSRNDGASAKIPSDLYFTMAFRIGL